VYHDDMYPLGPLDQPVAPQIPVAVVLVYPASNGRDSIRAQRLKQAIASVLDYYPFLAGRLCSNADDGSHSIHKLDAGSIFTEATCRQRLSDFMPPHADRLTLAHLPSSGNALLCPFNPVDIADQPVLSIQYTRFSCGGVSLGIRILHKVVDAIGCFSFVRHLLEAYTRLSNGNEAIITSPPTLSAYDPARALPRIDNNHVPSPSYFTAAALAPTSKGLNDTGATATVTGRFLRAGSEELNSLKRRATVDHTPISTFVALTSFLYQTVHRARLRLRQHDSSISPLSPTHYLTSVNVRTLLGLTDYPHNGLITPNTAITETALASGPLDVIASAIHDMVRTSLDVEAVEDTARWISAQPDKSRMRSTFEYGPGAFMTSAWNRIDMYGADFEVDGTGPTLVSTPFTPISLVDGLAYFLPLPRGDEGLEVCLALDDRVWRWLDEDEHWTRVFGVHKSP
jgi:hypothetical protein